jgi:hypothetical protein
VNPSPITPITCRFGDHQRLDIGSQAMLEAVQHMKTCMIICHSGCCITTDKYTAEFNMLQVTDELLKEELNRCAVDLEPCISGK